MNFKQTVSIQAYQGLLGAVIIFIFPAFFLQHLSIDSTAGLLANQLFRLTAVFIAIVCLTLLAIRNIQDINIQRRVMLVNMSLDFFGALFLAYAAYTNTLDLLAGLVLSLLLLMSSLGYVPALLSVAPKSH